MMTDNLLDAVAVNDEEIIVGNASSAVMGMLVNGTAVLDINYGSNNADDVPEEDDDMDDDDDADYDDDMDDDDDADYDDDMDDDDDDMDYDDEEDDDMEREPA